MLEIDAGPRQAMARFEDAVLRIFPRFRSVRRQAASRVGAPRLGAQSFRLAMAG